ncbi:MAG: nucleotidyltransferase family protein [Clostridia bacterium]|nr:nucleotidyltransferase family protein [Clostridia bacterium]
MEINDQDILLLRLLFSQEPYTEEQLNYLLEGLDLDQEKTEHLLLFAFLGNRGNWRFFPGPVKARTEGVYRAARVRNIYGVPRLKEQLRLLNEAGIPVMFLKGMAMRCHYAPGAAREMSDFDLAVPENRFTEAKEILLHEDETGIGSVSPYAVTIESPQKNIDLHRWIFKRGGKPSSFVWEHAIPIDFQGMQVFVPDPQDMLIHLADSKARDLVQASHLGRKLMWIFDLRMIIEGMGTVNWAEITERAERYGLSYYLRTVLPAFSKVFPELLSESDLKTYFSKEKKDHIRSTELEFYRKAFLKYSSYVEQHGVKNYSFARTCRAVSHAWASYRWYLGPEFREEGLLSNFYQFLCLTCQADGVRSLVRQYFDRRS